MKWFKKVVDEREELELLRIEHIAYYCILAIALGAYVIKSCILNMSFASCIVELLIIIVAAVISIFAAARKGAWDYYSKPNKKNYFFYSLGGSLIFTLLFAFGRVRNMEYFKQDFAGRILPVALVMFVTLFVLCYVTLAIMGAMAKKKRENLEKELEEETDDE